MIGNEKAGNIAFRTILFSGFAVSLCCLSLSAAVAAEENKPQDPGKKIVARVNGNPIYEEQLEPVVNENIKKWKKYGLKQDSSKLTSRLQMRALSKVIDQELINQEAHKIPLTNADEKVEKKLQAMKRKHGSEERFQSY